MSSLAIIVSLVAMPPASPFPVDPVDVPKRAVDYVKRTMVRHPGADPLDDDLARLLVAGVIAVLAGGEAVEDVAVLASEYTLKTGAVVAIQAAGS